MCAWSCAWRLTCARHDRMKLGADNPKKTGVAIGLMVLSILLLAYMMSSSSTPAAESATATDASTNTAVRPGRVKRNRQASAKVLTDTLDPRLRLDLLKTSEQTTYAGSGRNIFRAEVEVAVIPQPVKPPIPQPYVPPPPPPPPPINLKFFGFASHPGEPKKIFLAQGEEVFVAAEGDIVNRRYKVMHIGVNSVDIQDVLNNNVQTIPLSQG
jgi:hypothetical protein